MNAKQFIEHLKTKQEVNFLEVIRQERAEVGGVEHTGYSSYKIEYMPRRGWVPEHVKEIVNLFVHASDGDIGTYRQDVVLKVSETEVAWLHLRYPECPRRRGGGVGTIDIYSWAAVEAQRGIEAVVAEVRKSVAMSYLYPVIEQREALFGGGNWVDGLVEALAGAMPDETKPGALWSLADAAIGMASVSARHVITEMAQALASMELEYVSEYDDQGCAFMSLSTITLSNVAGESWFFGSYDDPFEAGEHTGAVEQFANEVEDELDITFDPDDDQHQGAFGLWMAFQFGASD